MMTTEVATLPSGVSEFNQFPSDQIIIMMLVPGYILLLLILGISAPQILSKSDGPPVCVSTPWHFGMSQAGDPFEQFQVTYQTDVQDRILITITDKQDKVYMQTSMHREIL